MTLACRIHAARDLRLEQAPDAELGPTDCEIRLGAGGICGSDLHYFQPGRVGALVVREPLIPGHEASHVAVYDHGAHLLLSGDSIYPGHIFIQDWRTYRASMQRLEAFLSEAEGATLDRAMRAAEAS